MESEFFGEWVFYHDEEDKKEAYTYLELWKKQIIIKLAAYGYEFVDWKYIDNKDIQNFKGNTIQISTLAIKIEMRKKDV
jgi:hypothetical protein